MNANTRTRWWLFGSVAVVGLALDLITKYWIANTMQVGETTPLIGQWLQIMLVYNKGAIFGLDPRDLNPHFPTNAFFYVFSVLALVILVFYYRSLKGESWLTHVGVALITPGALGNLFDRLAFPDRGVVDFIMFDIGIPPFDPWPIFNLADVYITVGVGIILLGLVREGLSKNNESSEDKPSDTASLHDS
ncbi:MAG: signal peptidase II [Chitinivibrionales bacterium]|nr:signal peptidase II [Chitinivibrionales bacterium]MBD3357996.1 signal peptidase II [Chitinivibrionales bacterium]